MTRELTTSVGRQKISLRDWAAALFGVRASLLTFVTVIAGTVIVDLVVPTNYRS